MSNFWGKTKPPRQYFDGGSVSFSVDGDKLWYKIIRTTKTSKDFISGGKVGSKKHLEELLSIKSINEIINRSNSS